MLVHHCECHLLWKSLSHDRDKYKRICVYFLAGLANSIGVDQDSARCFFVIVVLFFCKLGTT